MSRKRGRVKSSRKPANPQTLPVIEAHAAGIDLGSRQHWVAAPPLPDASPCVESFGTTTDQLWAMVDWLHQQGVDSVAMESTGVLWIPVFELLESQGFRVILVNARQLHHVPGRKTDFLDCQWIQLLHSCGLLKGSFRPADAICQWRSLVRERHTLVEERADWVRRMQKALDQMNVCVHHAVSDLTGVTGMKILRAIVAGERDPHVLARLRDRRCRKSQAEIAAELTGHWREDHLFNLAQALRLYDQIDQMIGEYDHKILATVDSLVPPEHRGLVAASPTHPAKARKFIAQGSEPLRQTLYQLAAVDLTTTPGVGTDTALVFLSELGPDLSPFPTESNFVSYLRLAPHVGETGGRRFRPKHRFNTTTRVGQALRMAALSVRNSNSALGAYYRRLSRREGASVAVFATARKIAQILYRLLRYGQHYVDIGAQAYEARFQQRRLKHYTQALKSMGYKVLPIENVPISP